MNAGPSEAPRLDAVWTTEQVLAWMDSFRELILNTEEGDQPYDRVRRADPMRRVALRSDGK